MGFNTKKTNDFPKVTPGLRVPAILTYIGWNEDKATGQVNFTLENGAKFQALIFKPTPSINGDPEQAKKNWISSNTDLFHQLVYLVAAVNGAWTKEGRREFYTKLAEGQSEGDEPTDEDFRQLFDTAYKLIPSEEEMATIPFFIKLVANTRGEKQFVNFPRFKWKWELQPIDSLSDEQNEDNQRIELNEKYDKFTFDLVEA